MPPLVVVVGSFVQDLAFSCERFPAPGETVVGRFASGPGGKGSNQAVAAGRAGVPTCFVGAVGRDLFAAEARRFYRAEGIAARFVARPPHATGTASILVNRSGQNQIVVALGASAELRPRDVPAALLRGAKVAICQHEANLPINAHVFRLARRAGAVTVLNPAPMRADFDPAILALTDVLIPNETEFVAIARRVPATAALLQRRTGADFTEAALAALAPAEWQRLCRALGVPVVIVTLGARGCFVSQAGQGSLLPAHPVRAVDTTGAGDAFVGGFAAGLVLHAGDVVAAARHGNAVAALSVTKPGTAPAMPRRAEIARLLRRAPKNN
jgi:ribokinase